MVASLFSPLTSRPARPVSERSGRAAASRREALHDSALVIRFKAGDEAAFVEIVGRYREKLLGVALGLLRNRADAEEIAQDALMRAHRGLADFRGESSLAAWLYCIALNLSRNRYAYFFRRRRHLTFSLDCPVSTDSPSTFIELIAGEQPDPAREATQREFAIVIAECMARLRTKQQEILRLRNVRQYSYAEIARLLGLEIGTVKSRIARARADLRLMISKCYPECAANATLAEWFEPARPSGRLVAVA